MADSVAAGNQKGNGTLNTVVDLGSKFAKSACGADVPPGQTTVQCQQSTKKSVTDAATGTVGGAAVSFVKTFIFGPGDSKVDIGGSVDFGGPNGVKGGSLSAGIKF